MVQASLCRHPLPHLHCFPPPPPLMLPAGPQPTAEGLATDRCVRKLSLSNPSDKPLSRTEDRVEVGRSRGV